MPGTIEAEETFNPGKEIVLQSPSPTAHYAVVFEDDGDTGYFYGLDHSREGNPIVDAMHIYNVASVVDKEKPSLAEIGWSQDGLKAALLINGYPHAVFDFSAKRGYCRTNFPPPDSKWTSFSHEWSDSALDLF